MQYLLTSSSKSYKQLQILLLQSAVVVSKYSAFKTIHFEFFLKCKTQLRNLPLIVEIKRAVMEG